MDVVKISSLLSKPKNIMNLNIIVEAKCNDCKSGNIAMVTYYESKKEEKI